MPDDAKKGLPVRVTPDQRDDFPLQSSEPSHPLTGAVRITLTMPYFRNVADARKWVQENIPKARNRTRGDTTYRNVYDMDGDVRIVIQVARTTVKWE